MNLFDDINVANVTCSSDFEFNVLGKPTALYVIVQMKIKLILLSNYYCWIII